MEHQWANEVAHRSEPLCLGENPSRDPHHSDKANQQQHDTHDQHGDLHDISSFTIHPTGFRRSSTAFPRSRAQCFHEQPQRQYRGCAVDHIARNRFRAKPCRFSAENLRHSEHDSDEGHEPDQNRRYPPPHDCVTSCSCVARWPIPNAGRAESPAHITIIQENQCAFNDPGDRWRLVSWWVFPLAAWPGREFLSSFDLCMQDARLRTVMGGRAGECDLREPHRWCR